MKNREIKVRYSDDSDVLLVTYGLDIASGRQFNGCQVFLNELGVIVAYIISGHSERPNVNRNFMPLLGQPAECLEGCYGLA